MYDILFKLYTGAKIVPTELDEDGIREILKALYEALNALDTTSSALLIFNGVVITAAAFAAEKDYLAPGLRIWAVIVIGVGLVASGLCLRVTHISYAFYGKVEVVSKPVLLNFRQEFAALDHEIAVRTCMFQIAWGLSMFIVFGTIVVILLAVVAHFWRRPFGYPGRGGAGPDPLWGAHGSP